ncbi:MAG: hypothetical protein AAB382_10530 [Chloroflexota bacterium]
MKQKNVANWRLQAGLMVVAIVMLIVAIGATPAQTESERYFDETGHTVRGPFLAFFDSHGGLFVFGYPITDEYVDNGRLVQYFQRARFEWHPENPEGFRVQLGLLGDELGWGQPPLKPNQIPAPGNPYCVYFAQTGHSVCNSFLDYFRDHGGIDVFGYPISEFYIERDRIVQAFQRGRMEWHPEKPTNQKVQLTEIGTLAYQTFKLDPSRLDPKPPANQPRIITRLNARASVSSPVTGRAGSQTIYVVVVDQHGAALDGALATATIKFSSGDQTYTLPLTDARGISKLNVPFGQTKVGDYVVINVSAAYQNLTTQTRTSFLPWW